jgi:hypothetical protein
MTGPIDGLLGDFQTQDKHSFKPLQTLFSARNPFSRPVEEA